MVLVRKYTCSQLRTDRSMIHNVRMQQSGFLAAQSPLSIFAIYHPSSQPRSALLYTRAAELSSTVWEALVDERANGAT